MKSSVYCIETTCISYKSCIDEFLLLVYLKLERATQFLMTFGVMVLIFQRRYLRTSHGNCSTAKENTHVSCAKINFNKCSMLYSRFVLFCRVFHQRSGDDATDVPFSPSATKLMVGGTCGKMLGISAGCKSLSDDTVDVADTHRP